MQTDNKKIALAAAKTGQTAPHTRFGELRDLLAVIEKRIAKLKEINSEDLLGILPLFDQAENRLAALENAGVNTGSERAHLESLLMQFRKRGVLFVNRAGGSAALRQARQDRQPNEDRWWWFIDAIVAGERKSSLRRWGSGILVLAIILIGFAFIYQRFLAPDPAFQASYGLHQDAEAALVAGDPQLALEKVNEALTYTPDNPELYMLQGVIYLALEDPEAAETSFKIAKQKFESDDFFYAKRSGFYVLIGQPDLAIEDANTAIALNPDLAFAYIYRGQAYELMGNISAASADYERASEIAEQTGDAEIQVIARMHLAQILQQVIPMVTETPE